jgi:hypothetical protein
MGSDWRRSGEGGGGWARTGGAERGGGGWVRVAASPVHLNSRAVDYAARRNNDTWRDRSGGGDDLWTGGLAGVSGWAPFVSPTWRACPGASGLPHTRPIFGLDMGGAGQPGRLRAV